MVAILRGNVQQGGFVADMVITGGIAGNVLTSPINANALPATFDGSSIFALNASNVSTGVLSVLRGGTGTTTSTGSGNVVLSDNPTLQGNITVGNVNSTNLPSIYNRGIFTGVYASTSNPTYLTIGLDVTNYKVHEIYYRFNATSSGQLRFNLRLGFTNNAGSTAYSTGTHENNIYLLKRSTGILTLDHGTGAALIAQFADTNQDIAGKITVYNQSISRSQIQTECSYTYGGVGSCRSTGSLHPLSASSQGSITQILLYFEQYDGSNLLSAMTGSTGQYYVVGYK